jgi:tetratricopeptide (TPR) repeat protein
VTTIFLHHYVEQVEKLIDDNRLVEAIEHCRHILQSYPRHIDTYRVMGKALLEKQEYSAANDLFLRILCADPNDFISHVGLSIINKEERQTDQALWHLERAYEIQPYNVAIQGELRKLYAAQADTRPGVIPLTRGALARLYMQGELYQQAISELRRILAEEPDRMDLQVLLAEALWRDDQRIDAEEICLQILNELPNCIVANAILAEIWLHTGRIPEAQKYLHRLHGLTWQTQNLLDKETIEGQTFATEGAFPLPAEASLDFLQTGGAESDKPAKPTDDWVKEVRFDDLPADAAELDQVVQETESGMHSYDWLADIGEMAEDEETAVASESDWFSQSPSKESLNLSTGELSAEWLADLRNQESDSGFQPLDMEEIPDDLFEDTKPADTDWFADEDKISDEEIAAFGLDLDDTAVSSKTSPPAKGLPNWLDALADDEPAIEIDATNLMDDSLINWADSEPPVVQEPKTPFWLSEMADEEIEAVQLDPEDMLDWMNEPDEEEFEEALADDELLADEEDERLEDDLSFLDEIALPEEDASQNAELEFGPTVVLNIDETDEAAPVPSDTDALGGADDWLAALTEDGLDETFAWDDVTAAEKAQTFDEIDLEASTDELAALSDADDWLQSAAADLDAILEMDELEEDEFPNLAIPELEGDDITTVPDWLDQEEIDLPEESEAAVSSENDPEKTPKPEEPEMEPADALDWLDELTSEPVEDAPPLPEPPIETEGMPSWLNSAKDDSDVEMVDEWNSASADIPDWLQESVSLADLDNDEALLDEDFEAGSGLTGLLAEMDVTDEPLSHRPDGFFVF